MTTTFDPATWLAKAEAAGYEINATLPERGIMVWTPHPRRISTEEDVALWREARGGDADNAKHDALEAHLLEAGRVVDHRTQAGAS